MRYLSFFVILFALQLSSSQTIYVVNNTPGLEADFTTVQAAVDAAKDGDIIHIQHSDVEYNLAEVSKRLTIYGRSHSKKDFITKAYIKFVEGSAGSELQGIRGGVGFDGVVKNIRILNCKLEGNLELLDRQKTYLYSNIQFIGNVITDGNVIWLGANCSNFEFKHNIITMPIKSDMVENTLFLENNIFVGSLISINTEEKSTISIKNSLFICNEDQDNEMKASAGFNGAIIFENCYTYNYNTSFKYSFSNHETVTLSNSKENVNPMFVNVNPNGISIASSSAQFNADEDDLHLQPNSQVNDAGVYGK